VANIFCLSLQRQKDGGFLFPLNRTLRELDCRRGSTGARGLVLGVFLFLLFYFLIFFPGWYVMWALTLTVDG